MLRRKVLNNNQDVELAILELCDEYHFNNILVTRSDIGMTLLTKGEFYHMATIAQKVYDVTGAGDTVIAVISSLLNKGFIFVRGN